MNGSQNKTMNSHDLDPITLSSDCPSLGLDVAMWLVWCFLSFCSALLYLFECLVVPHALCWVAALLSYECTKHLTSRYWKIVSRSFPGFCNKLRSFRMVQHQNVFCLRYWIVPVHRIHDLHSFMRQLLKKMVLFRGGLATLENAGFNREHWCRELKEVSQVSWNLSWRLWC